jgi:hypothetical protein
VNLASGNLLFRKKQTMTENNKYLQQAAAAIKAFETEKEPERLREAYVALENVNIMGEHIIKVRNQVRKTCLYLWLDLLQILDHYRDPKFEPKDVPSKLVDPPKGPGGEVLRPGTNPASISDPKERAAYEKAIADNRKKIENYRLQVQFGRLNDRIVTAAELFIRTYCVSSEKDRGELRVAIDAAIKTEKQKSDLLKRLLPSSD